MTKIALLLGFFWGVFYALWLQQTKYGRFLVQRRTWIAVVLGIGVDVLIMALVLPFDQLLIIAGVLATSAVGIVVRSLYLESRDQEAIQEYLSAK